MGKALDLRGAPSYEWGTTCPHCWLNPPAAHAGGFSFSPKSRGTQAPAVIESPPWP